MANSKLNKSSLHAQDFRMPGDMDLIMISCEIWSSRSASEAKIMSCSY